MASANSACESPYKLCICARRSSHTWVLRAALQVQVICQLLVVGVLIGSIEHEFSPILSPIVGAPRQEDITSRFMSALLLDKPDNILMCR